ATKHQRRPRRQVELAARQRIDPRQRLRERLALLDADRQPGVAQHTDKPDGLAREVQPTFQRRIKPGPKAKPRAKPAARIAAVRAHADSARSCTARGPRTRSMS